MSNNADRSKKFLKEALRPSAIKDDDDLSAKLGFLFIISNTSPKKFRKLNLDRCLHFYTQKLLNSLPRSFFKKLISKIREHKLVIDDLQPKLDRWFYTKTIGYGDEYRVDKSLIKKFVTEDKIKQVSDSDDAVFLYIYIRILSACDPKKYKHLERYFPLLERVAKQKPQSYGYFLTHVILYDTHFGHKKPSKKALKALVELHKLCEHSLKLERENVDLISEIIVCCKVCKVCNFPHYRRLLNFVNQTRGFTDYHEKSVLAAATF
jgi:hypothetical protein